MKVLQVFNRYLVAAGEENSAARIARDLESGGHEVVRFWRSTREWLEPGAPRKLRQALLLWNNPGVLAELAALHRSKRTELWILHNVIPVVSLGVYRLACELGVPVFQWLHNFRPLSPSGTLAAGGRLLEPDDPWRVWKEICAGSWNGRFLTAWLALANAWRCWRGDFNWVAAWIAISDDLRERFRRAGWQSARLFTLRHSWHIQHPPAEPGPFFLFLGRMVETKGVQFLLELWRHPALSSVPLVLAGEGPIYDQLGTHRTPNVRWAGPVQGEQKRQLLEDCRAVLVPSLWPEPLGIVTYEAYEFGKPVLSSGTGGLKEITFDGQTGRILPLNQPALWRQAVLDLANQPDLARAWGRQGRHWLEKNASPARWNREFNAICENALNRGLVRPSAQSSEVQ